MRGFFLFIGVAFSLTFWEGIPSSYAADMTAEQSALLHDLLVPLTKSSVPKGVDPNVFQDALSVLKEEKLLTTGGRPHFKETGILDAYGKAMFMGARSKDFAHEIGEIHDLVAKGNPQELKAALRDLWKKAGRKNPDDKALEPVLASLYGAKGAEPQETVNLVFDKPGHKVEVVHARAGGRMQVNVINKDKGGNPISRTVIQGVTQTVPTDNGHDLHRGIELDQVCTNTEESDQDRMPRLSGEWLSNDGSIWTISGTADALALHVERGGGRPSLMYNGSFRLGRIYAEHLITRADSIDPPLPLEVRSQIAARGNVTFRVYLEECGYVNAGLNGTWSSQHVTYSGMTLGIRRIHDPYDLSLTFTRNRETDSAQGAADGVSL